MNERISAKKNDKTKFVDIFGAKMAYQEMGSGNPILFLHSIPMSSYTWRNVIPSAAKLGRCIVPDLIGFGESDKPTIDYSIADHIKYITKFIDVLGLHNLTLVMHGYGSIIGLHYAMHEEKNCRALVLYEAFLRSSDNDELSLPLQEQLVSLENVELTPNNGASFIDHVLPQHIMARQFSDEEMNQYRAPFENASTQPLVKYIQEFTSKEGKKELDRIIKNYSKKLTQSKLPKLLLFTVPGFVTTVATIMWAKEHLPNLEILDLGEELHSAQETYPELMGEAISVWLQGLEVNKRK